MAKWLSSVLQIGLAMINTGSVSTRIDSDPKILETDVDWASGCSTWM
jgi:hypothetical protein